MPWNRDPETPRVKPWSLFTVPGAELMDGFEPVFKESPGAHIWFNWPNYLIEFTPQLFQ